MYQDIWIRFLFFSEQKKFGKNKYNFKICNKSMKNNGKSEKKFRK